MSYNVATYGAVGDGVTDDSAAINSAIAAASAAGVKYVDLMAAHKVSKHATDPGYGCILMKSGVTLRGLSTTGTVLTLAASQPNFTRVIVADGVINWGVCDLTIDGNKANQTVNEHRAGIFVWRSNTSTLPCPRWGRIRDVEIRNCTGDAIDLHLDVQDTIVERAYCHDNVRKGVTINAGNQRRMTIRDSQFQANDGGSIVVESNTPLDGLTIENCLCEANYSDGGLAISIAGPGVGANRAKNVLIRNNEIFGCVRITRCEHVRIDGLNKIAPTSALTNRPLVIQYDCVDISVSGNDIGLPSNSNGMDGAVYVVGASDGGSYYQPRQVRVMDNHIWTDYNNGMAVDVRNARDVVIAGNSMVSEAASHVVAAVGCSATVSAIPVKSVLVANNYIRDFKYGVLVGSVTGCEVLSLTANNNVFEKVNHSSTIYAWYLDYNAYGILKKCAMSGNELLGASGFNPTNGYPQVPILIGGTRGLAGQYLCSGSPNGAITEAVGATAYRRDGGTATGLYVCEAAGNSGWMPK